MESLSLPQSRLQGLDEIEQRIWSELERCVAPRPRGHDGAGSDPHEWRVAVLATVDAGQPDARNIVVREIDAREHRLVFYTDARSPKVRQIEATPQGTLMFWSRALGWQLRMQVRLAVETSGLAVSSRWARLQTTAGAYDYLAATAPGSELDAPLADLGTRSHFAMIEAMAESVDWLELHPDGHRRAQFGAGGPRWLQP
jgi:hypothetical protein